MSFFLIFVGIILVILFFVFKSIEKFSAFRPIIKMLASAFIIFGILSAFIVQIDAGYIGVKKLFGKIEPDVLNSGLNFVNPVVEVIKMDTKTQNYTMSAVHDEGQKQGDDAIRILTSDGLEVTIDLTVLFKIDPNKAPNLLIETGDDYEYKIVRPVTRTEIRNNAVYYEAVALYSTKRNEFQSKIFSAIEKEFRKRGLILESLLIRNIELPASVKTVIEQKIQAEQEAQKMQFVLLKEKQEAERKRVEAQGIADYQSKLSSSLNSQLIQYEQIKAIKELAQSQNAKIVMMGNNPSPIIIDGK